MKSLFPPFLLFFGAFFVSWLYQTPPSLGDDLNYWGLAFDLHHGVEDAWSAGSFHDLRWPVWGLCWLLQIPFGFGALSYYLQPMIYLGAGASVVFFLAREVGARPLVAFVAGLLFLFHPQLDTLIDRPMPDLSEGFWVALAFLTWLKLVHPDRPPLTRAALALAIGLILAIGQANRITGVFAVPLLGITALLFHRRQFAWLLLAGAFAALFVGIETIIYHQLTGDWLHSIHANSTATGRTGTEAIPLWEFPFRFLPGLFRRYTDVIFNLIALAGLVPAILHFGKPGRALATYAIVYYLTYSCAVQSFDPPRPLVRDGDRFLGSLAYPLAVLTSFGLTFVLSLVVPRIRSLPGIAWLERHPALCVAALAVGLSFLALRPYRGPNFLDDISAYMDTIPAGTTILSHPAMLHVVSMANGTKASQFEWHLRKDLLQPSPSTLWAADQSDAIWFNRKWIWTGTRKDSEYGRTQGIGEIAPYLRPPMDDWSIQAALTKGDVPDFVFLSRRKPGQPLKERTTDGRLLTKVLLPALEGPGTWTFPGKPSEPLVLPTVPIPPELRGRTLLLALRYSSNKTEPIRAEVYFLEKDREFLDLVFKPYFFPESSEDFFFVTIPPNADAVKVRLRRAKETTRITLDSLRLFIDTGAPLAR